MTTAVVPEALSGLAGQFLDCDAHLYQHPEDMETIVGPVGGGYVIELIRQYAASGEHRTASARKPRG